MLVAERNSSLISGEATWPLLISREQGQVEERQIATAWVANHKRPNLLLVTGWGENELEKYAWLFNKMGIHLGVCNLAYEGGGEDYALTPEVVEQTIIKGTTAVIQALNDMAGRQDPNYPLYAVGRSKGAADLEAFADAKPWMLRGVGVLAPTGYNFAAMGETRSKQRRGLLNRLNAAGIIKPNEQIPVANDTKGLSVGEENRRSLRELQAGLRFAETKDPATITKRLHDAGLLKEIVVIQHDVICPEPEYRPALAAAGLADFTREIPGRHSPLPELMAVLQTALVIRYTVPQKELWLPT